jgi:N-acylneuraminate cytidylyltransferase
VRNKIACIIPVRSGSKRIKNKNIVKIGKIPLIKLVCKKIIKSKIINSFFIASDDIKIYQKIGEYKKKVTFFKRSKKSSTSNAQSEIVIEEFLDKYKKFDIIVFVQVTNPFVNHYHLDKALKIFITKKYDTLLSVVKSRSFLWKNKFPTQPLNYDYNNRELSQNLKNYYVENGSFYIFYRKNFLKFKNRLHKKIGTYEMSQESIFEIDEIEDLKIIRKLII